MATQQDKVWLGTICAQNGLSLSEEQLLSIQRLAVVLLEWNKKINLISRKDEENFWTSHLLHSLALLFKVHIPNGSAVLDLGTGGGLPGLPLKIARPDLSLTLLDSTQKKINVVKNIIETLGLAGIDAVWGRAEELGKSVQYKHRYDVVVARAVASLKDLVQWSEPFLTQVGNGAGKVLDNHATVRLNGPVLIALKGGDLETEIGQAKKLPQVKTITVLDLTLKGSSQLDGGDKKIVLVEFGRISKQKAE
jgi:16S rRNA (guanine(527)-N(7))-methyltransferase RsmG